MIGSFYRDIHFEELLPLFNNLVKVGDHSTSRVYDIVVSFLTSLNHSFLPLRGSYLVGSSLTDLFAVPTEHNDIDMKIIIEGTQAVAKEIFSSIEQLPFFMIDEVVYSLELLAHETFKPIYISGFYSFKGYTFQGYGQNRPFEISVIVTDCFNMLPPTVMNIDSLFIPVTLFVSPPHFAIGSLTPENFRLYSTQGSCDSVIQNIKNGILTCKEPNSVKKFGWARYLNAITNGFICQDPEINRIFCENEMENLETCIYDINQFVQKKKQFNFESYWIFFICNAIFQCPDKKRLVHLLRHFRSLLDHQRQSLIWVLCLKKILTTPFPLEDIPTLLQLLIPLFSQSFVLKNHVEKTWLQCELKGQNKNLYILIPYTFSQKAETIPSIAPILKKIVDNVEFDGLNQEQKLHFFRSILEKRETFQAFLEQDPECFSEKNSPLDIVLMILNCCTENEKSELASSLIDEVLMKYQKNLWNMPSDFWEKLLRITSRLAKEEIEDSSSWNRILSNLMTDLFKEETPEFVNQSISACIVDLLRLSNYSWDDKEKLKQSLLLYNLIENIDYRKGEEALESLLRIVKVQSTPRELNKDILHFSHHFFCLVLKADTSRAVEWIENRLEAISDHSLTVWQIYKDLFEEEEISHLIEEQYLITDSCALYLRDAEDKQLKEACKKAIHFRLQKNISSAYSLISSCHLFDKQDGALIFHRLLKAISQRQLNCFDFSIHSLLSLLEGYCDIEEIQSLESEILLGVKFCLNALRIKIKKMPSPYNLEAALVNCSKKICLLYDKTINQTSLMTEISSLLICRLVNERKNICYEPAKEMLMKIHHPRLKDDRRANFALDLEVYCTFIESTAGHSADPSLIYTDLLTLLLTIPNQEKAAELTNRLSKTLLSLWEREMPIQHAIPLMKIGFELISKKNNRLLVPKKMQTQEALSSFLSFVLFHTQADRLYYYCILKEFYQVLLHSPHLIQSHILQEFIKKGLEVPNLFMDGERAFLGSATLLSVSYKTCIDYSTPFPCKGTHKSQVIEALRTFLSFPDQAKVMDEVGKLLIDLSSNELLDIKFIDEIAQEITTLNHTSLADAYLHIFMNPFFFSCIPWNIFVKILENIKIESWETEKINLFMTVFSIVLDGQLALHLNKPLASGESLNSILSFYLELVAKCSAFSLSTNLLADLVERPTRYSFHPRDTTALLAVFDKLGDKIVSVGYKPLDVSEGKVSAFLRGFHFFWNTLSLTEKENHKRILSKLTPRPSFR